MTSAYRIAADTLDDWRKQWRTCRMCGKRVKLSDDVCPDCGAAAPIVVPVWVGALAAVFAGAACILIAQWHG